MSRSRARKIVNVAVAQMTSTNDVAANLAVCMSLIDDAARRGAEMIFLPECCDFVSRGAGEARELATRLDDPSGFVASIARHARDRSIWVSLGGVHELPCGPSDEGEQGIRRLRNAHVVISSNGDRHATYGKVHMFDAVGLQESSFTEPGAQLVAVDALGVRVGLGVCYDVRFPAFAAALRTAGQSDVLTFPSAFTLRTGLAHWEPLLRARAIETQTYVIAAAQVGVHQMVVAPGGAAPPSSKPAAAAARESFGHAMIVDPWGTVIADCGGARGSPRIAIAQIDTEVIDAVRRDMPVASHTRPEVYAGGVNIY
jgi:predicted amidohydrolase